MAVAGCITNALGILIGAANRRHWRYRAGGNRVSFGGCQKHCREGSERNNKSHAENIALETPRRKRKLSSRLPASESGRSSFRNQEL